jgi:hypothetical protein
LCDELHDRRAGNLCPKDSRSCGHSLFPEKIRPSDLKKLINSLKLKKACGIVGIPNECLRHLPRSPLVHLTHLYNHRLRLSYLPNAWNEAKIITLP